MIRSKILSVEEFLLEHRPLRRMRELGYLKDADIEVMFQAQNDYTIRQLLDLFKQAKAKAPLTTMINEYYEEVLQALKEEG